MCDIDKCQNDCNLVSPETGKQWSMCRLCPSDYDCNARKIKTKKCEEYCNQPCSDNSDIKDILYNCKGCSDTIKCNPKSEEFQHYSESYNKKIRNLNNLDSYEKYNTQQSTDGAYDPISK